MPSGNVREALTSTSKGSVSAALEKTERLPHFPPGRATRLTYSIGTTIVTGSAATTTR